MKTLTARDLINTGVFSAIYFALTFLFGMLGLFGPAAMPVGAALALIANGVTIALFQYRVPKIGAMTLLGLIMGLLMTVTGHSWYSIVLAAFLGLAADGISYLGSWRRPLLQALSYAVFTCWYIAPVLPLFFNSEAYFTDIAIQMGESYAESFRQMLTPTFVIVWQCISFVIALVGGLFGQSVVRRHFSRAGLTA